MTSELIIELRGVKKQYGGVVALDGVDVSFERGMVHAILGENGAGKSTLIKILAGVTRPTEGQLVFHGQSVILLDPRAAAKKGVACVFQELSLIPDLSVADNIFLNEGHNSLGFYRRGKLFVEAQNLLANMGCDNIDSRGKVRSLPLPQRQLVEIAKALAKRPKVLILDESTSALGEREVRILFSIVRKLRDEGCAIIYISHRMHEIKEIADTCTVFRNGRSIATFKNGTQSEAQIIAMMIGRDISQMYPPRPASAATATPLVEVRDLHWQSRLDGVNFLVRPGEIYGIGGLDGQGQKETLQALYGALRGVRGEVRFGEARLPAKPHRALNGRPGIALIPEDRKNEGLHLHLSIADNLCIAAPGKVSTFGILDAARRDSLIGELVDRLKIKVSSVEAPVDTLSGGNQQKVVIAKYLATDPQVLLLSDPTRGIDVGTKSEIYRLLRQLADAGAAIVFHSTDYDELIGLADRVGIFFRGRIVKELQGSEISEEAILSHSFGLDAQMEGRSWSQH